MKSSRPVFLLIGIFTLFMATLFFIESSPNPPQALNTGTAPQPFATERSIRFTTNQTVIPAGGCVTLSWDVPEAARVILRGSNWPEGTQEMVEASGTTTACPSAALNYVPDDPVHYTLTISYANDQTETREIVITYGNPTPSPVGFVPTTATEIPLMPDTEVEAVFQAFEGGWIVWRGDINTYFVLFNTTLVFTYRSENILVPADDSGSPTLAPDGFNTHLQFYALWKYGWLSKSKLSGLLGIPTDIGTEYRARVFNQSEYSFEMLLPDGSSSVSLQMNENWVRNSLVSGHWSVTGVQPTFSPTLTPYPTVTPAPIHAIYQAFEHGFMVMSELGNCVYAFANGTNDQPGNIIIPADAGPEGLPHEYYYCLEAAELPDNPIKTAPDGLLLPTGAIGKVWGAYDEIQTFLGYATEEPIHYARRLPSSPAPVAGGGPWTSPVIPLPDGTDLWCGFRSATSHSCTVG